MGAFRFKKCQSKERLVLRAGKPTSSHCYAAWDAVIPTHAGDWPVDAGIKGGRDRLRRVKLCCTIPCRACVQEMELMSA